MPKTNSDFLDHGMYWIIRSERNGAWEILQRFKRPLAYSIYAGYSNRDKAFEKMKELNERKF